MYVHCNNITVIIQWIHKSYKAAYKLFTSEKNGKEETKIKEF